jgi:hypothetical protein
VAIVNERMAKRYWGTLDVVGKHISTFNDGHGKKLWSKVVGVVSDVDKIRRR